MTSRGTVPIATPYIIVASDTVYRLSLPAAPALYRAPGVAACPATTHPPPPPHPCLDLGSRSPLRSAAGRRSSAGADVLPRADRHVYKLGARLGTALPTADVLFATRCKTLLFSRTVRLSLLPPLSIHGACLLPRSWHTVSYRIVHRVEST